MQAFVAFVQVMVTRVASLWTRPPQLVLAAWTTDEPAGEGRYVYHAIVVRQGGHVWGKGWYRSRDEAKAALAELVKACQFAAWGLKHTGVESAKVVRAWRCDSECDLYGSDWHTRMTDLSTQRKVIGRTP